MKTNQKGFTLLELVVVIAIIGIITSIAMLQYQQIKAKSQAAQLSSSLHVIEDGIITAIIDGRTKDAFTVNGQKITRANFSSSTLSSYLRSADFIQVPPGISFEVVTADIRGEPKEFQVIVFIIGQPGTERILDELEKMFPKQITHFGNREFVVIDSRTLAVAER